MVIFFTWRNHNHHVEGYIRECLNRAVANSQWRGLFPAARVFNGDPRHSDHRPVIITTERDVNSLRRRSGGGFKFEACWVEEEDFRKVVEEAWARANDSQNVRVAGALKGVAAGLSSWSQNMLGDLEKWIKKMRVELERCRAGGLSSEAVAREKILRFKLDRLEEQVDIYWRQRAHVKWLEKGDRNTGFFHATCSEKKRTNRVGRLKNAAGGWEETEEGKKAVISNYFSNLFRSSNIDGALQQLLDAVVPSVTEEMNEQLCQPFSAEEVKLALDSIGDLKAPGPDGMPSIFYKNCWDLVGNKVTAEVLDVLARGEIPEVGMIP